MMLKMGLPLLGLAVVATFLATSTSNNESRNRARALAEIIPYGLEMIQANELELGPTPPLICIVDSGIALDHPEFDATMINGIDNDNRFWMDPIEWDKDVSGHGTRLAGIIAAIGGNDIGIKGAANFPLFITRGLDDDGQAYASDIKKAVQQCVDANAKIILLGLGGQYDPKHEAFYQNIVDNEGVMVIAAAGNDMEPHPAFPARYDSVMAVGGVYESGQPWEGSAQEVEFVGPAHDVPSILPIEEVIGLDDTLIEEELTVHALNGTGSAAAYVTAAAGLLWSHFEECSNEEIRLALARTAYNWNDMADQVVTASPRTASNPDDEQIGHGLPQVFDAFYALERYGCDLSDVSDVSNVGPVLDIPDESIESESEEDEERDPEVDGFEGATMTSDELSGGAIGSIVAFVIFILLFGGFVTWLCCSRERPVATTPAAATEEPLKDEDDAQTIDEDGADPEHDA
jgi:hypothetical protein